MTKTMDQAIAPSQPRSQRQRNSEIPWYQPTISPEHGILLVLLGSFLTGSALAQTWSSDTTWACIAAFLGLQAEHPLIVQVKKRRRLQVRYALWALLYGSAALLLTFWLARTYPLLLWVCGGAIAALALDVVSVFRHTQKTILNEIMMFAAICLSTVFIYTATTGMITFQSLGFWVLNTLFFSSAVFTIKLRKRKTSALRPGLMFHGAAVLILSVLWGLGVLSPWSALTFALALLKLAVIIWQRDWYCTCHFGHVARFETYFALTYIFLAALTVLPARLPA